MIYSLYDWDDTLALTRKALYLSYKTALSKYDIQFDYHYFNDFIYDDATKFLKSLNFSDDEIKEIKSVKEYHYINTHIDEIILQLPDFKSENQYYIVTNTNANLVKQILEHKTGNALPWRKIVGTYEGAQRKPEPDLYVSTFENFIKKDWHPEHDEIHIYEDSVVGLLAASKFIHLYEKRIKNFTIHHVKHENPFKNL